MPGVREVQAGVWHWEAPHPEWSPGERWDEQVSSYAIEDGDGVLLFDPLAVPSEIEEQVSAVVLTCPWHERDARSLLERLGVPVLVPPLDEGSPDLDWLPAAGVEVQFVSAGNALPIAAKAFPGMAPNGVV
jgi:hypothetical protein